LGIPDLEAAVAKAPAQRGGGASAECVTAEAAGHPFFNAWPIRFDCVAGPDALADTAKKTAGRRTRAFTGDLRSLVEIGACLGETNSIRWPVKILGIGFEASNHYLYLTRGLVEKVSLPAAYWITSSVKSRIFFESALHRRSPPYDVLPMARFFA